MSCAEGQQPGFELGQRGGLQPAGRRGAGRRWARARSSHSGSHFDLDPAQLHGALPVADDDDRVVEGDLGHVDPADAKGEGPTPGPHLEDLAQRTGADDGVQPPSHRAVGAETARGRHGGRTSVTSSRWRRPLASAGRVSLRVISSWRPRRRVRTTKPARRDAPVVGVEVGVGQAPWRLGQRGHGAAVVGLDGEGGQGGQPPLDRAQVERVELPFDLDGVVRLSLSVPGSRTSRRGYCDARRPDPGRSRGGPHIATNGSEARR